jgi:hypothetical protein
MIQGSLPTKVCNIKKNQHTFPGQLSCKGTPLAAPGKFEAERFASMAQE